MILVCCNDNELFLHTFFRLLEEYFIIFRKTVWKVIRCESTNKQQGKQKRCMCEEKDDDICESLPTQGIL